MSDARRVRRGRHPRVDVGLRGDRGRSAWGPTQEWDGRLMPALVVDLPTWTLEAVRLGVLRELAEHAEDLCAELRQLVESPSAVGMEDVRHLFGALGAMVDVQDRVGWPGAQ